jgi:multidrug resistance efflux pump
MNIHIKKIINNLVEIKNQAYYWYKEQPRKIRFILPVSVALLTLLAIKFLTGGVKSDVETTVPRRVTVASVSGLSNMDGDFPLIGTVTSVSEATIRSEVSGKLVRVYKKLGDYVSTGGVIAEFENTGERASLLQAEGAYEQAKASRDITSLNSGQAGNTLLDTKNQALNTLYSTYSTMDDAISGKTDSSFSDAKFDQVKLSLSVPDATLVGEIEAKRKVIEKLLRERETKNKSLSTASDLLGELTAAQNEVQTIKTYLDNLFTAYAKAIPATSFPQSAIDAGKINVQVARQSVIGTLSSIVAARTSLSSTITANQVAGNQGSLVSGTQATAEAQVKQALGTYNAALSRLEKTIIRSPISGTLNSLSISTGDFIGAFTQVAVVSNNGALEIVSFVTDEDAKRITVGSPVTINEGVPGIITRIAGAIDPTTKKIEVRVGINDEKSGLINGQTVKIKITKNKKEVSSRFTGPLLIPISALKLTPRGANVFTVGTSSTLHALPVKEGAILGEQIQILEGLTGREDIVTDARGLKDGQVVEVSSQ